MSVRTYPDGKYKLPQYNVLLLSCIDLRLNDNITHFMDHDNLTNRYDQFILAGTSVGGLMGTARDPNDPEDHLQRLPEYEHWHKALTDHIDLAIKLHDIRDIYIIEHRNCGAYKAFLAAGRGDYDANGYDLEETDHYKYSEKLTVEILKYLDKRYIKAVAENPGKEIKKPKIHIHAFLMDLRGNIDFLHTTNPL